MNDIIRIEQNNQGQLVVDSRLIAEELGIKHKNLIATIKKYSIELEQISQLLFQTATVTNSRGARNSVDYCFLTEAQASFVMTLSRNTQQVVTLKLKLVQSFEKAKQIIKEVVPAQSDRIKELELQLKIAQLNKDSKQLDHTMMSIHGRETVLALRGREDQIIEIQVPTTEVIDKRHNIAYRGMTLVQLKNYLNKKYGFKIKNGKELERILESCGEQGLIATTPRTITSQYIPEENLKEAAIAIRSKLMSSRQFLLGENQ